MNLSSPNYILYVAQEAGFQSRSKLIPSKEFIKVRGKDYTILKEAATSTTLHDGERPYPIQNLIVLNYLPADNLSRIHKQESNNHAPICNELTHYADWGGEEGVSKIGDDLWLHGAIFNFCGGFNPIKNYTSCLQRTRFRGCDVNIVDSFLVLESTGGRVPRPPFDTVKEMKWTLYGHA
jgi:hypothetical protein